MSALPEYETDAAVIGAGVVGLAVARELAMAGREVFILEKADAIGTGTSSRNSEVIHAGIYYPQGSLKARACVEGKHALYQYASERHIPHNRCGKFIVATTQEQVGDLDGIRQKAMNNGVDDLTFITGADAMAQEPALFATGALVSPSTGIVDSHAYMASLLGDAESHGAAMALETEVQHGEVLPDGRIALVLGGKEPCRLIARELVNAAGLYAPHVASRIAGLDQSHVPGAWFAKGNYFSLAGKAPFSRLIYPVPEPGGLGTHLTIDLGGQARFGPDVEWADITSADEIDYTVAPERGDKFYAAIRCYWKGLEDGALAPAYSGMRPKIAPPGETADFVISGPDTHGAAGQVHLFGIESPGLTSSLALARMTVEALNAAR